MRTTRILALVIAASMASSPVAAGTLTIQPVEKLHYSWSFRGALAWIARVAFPVSGEGTLETRSGEKVSSRLTMISRDSSGEAFYASQMSPDGARTFASADGYSWRNRAERQNVTFDYRENLARVEKHDQDGVERKVRQLDTDTPQDVLTSIFYLRRNASEISSPLRATVYSGGKPYEFVFTPHRVTTLNVNGSAKRVKPFAISPVDAGRKGAVRVWLSDDSRRVPVRIEIEQDNATLRLDLVG